MLTAGLTISLGNTLNLILLLDGIAAQQYKLSSTPFINTITGSFNANMYAMSTITESPNANMYAMCTAAAE